jgi:RimJ/RimL family protein N-acetyltransferase
MQLSSGDIALRPLDLGDLADVVAACGDPEIVRFTLLVPSPYTEADGREFLTRVEERWRDGSSERTFAITGSDEFLGVISIDLADGVIGYWLKAEARGRGATTAALELIAAWALEHQGLTRLALTTHPDNVASQRVAEKAGFHRVGIVDEPRGFRDGTTRAVLFVRDAPTASVSPR